MAEVYVLVGSEDPDGFRIQIGQGESGIDMTEVTAVTLSVYRENGNTPLAWDATILTAPPYTATATTLWVEHKFQAGELPYKEVLTIVPKLTHPAGVSSSKPVCLPVKDPREICGGVC